MSATDPCSCSHERFYHAMSAPKACVKRLCGCKAFGHAKDEPAEAPA